MTAIVEGRDLTRAFPMPAGPVTALRDVSIAISPGEYVAIAGPSGCGKSTLLHLLGCVDAPTSGSLVFEGRDVARLTERERSRIRLTRIGFVFQRFFLLPMLMAVGVGLTIVNTRAVMEALFGVQSGFVRTAKYAIEGRPVNLETKKYRRKSGWLPYFEIGVGTYFLLMVAYAVETYNFLAIPFLSLFVAGYYWAGFGTLYQEYQGRLRWMEQRQLELGTAR